MWIFFSKASQVFRFLLHFHELTPKRTILQCSLLLVILVDRSIVRRDNESIPQPLRQRISCMVSVHKEANRESHFQVSEACWVEEPHWFIHPESNISSSSNLGNESNSCQCLVNSYVTPSKYSCVSWYMWRYGGVPESSPLVVAPGARTTLKIPRCCQFCPVQQSISKRQ